LFVCLGVGERPGLSVGESACCGNVLEAVR
jgi:ethanolamine ammonia-lyase small subunit